DVDCVDWPAMDENACCLTHFKQRVACPMHRTKSRPASSKCHNVHFNNYYSGRQTTTSKHTFLK
ncbi:hypothetical protein OS493_038874, partial [Desmophyllum pertusum]